MGGTCIGMRERGPSPIPKTTGEIESQIVITKETTLTKSKRINMAKLGSLEMLHTREHKPLETLLHCC